MKFTEKQARAAGLPVPASRKPQTASSRKADQEHRRKLFLAACYSHGIPEPLCEYQFDESRKWKFDFCWLAWPRVALEVEGGAYRGQGHRSVGVFLRNMEKYNEAAIAGWRLIRCTWDDVLKTGKVYPLIKRALGMEELVP